MYRMLSGRFGAVAAGVRSGAGAECTVLVARVQARVQAPVTTLACLPHSIRCNTTGAMYLTWLDEQQQPQPPRRRR